ncbi:site-specific integrase [Chitinophaga alhagiae]|uniref:site-specific integrase n=1 Tax=Chitinophaga alhagiae TaxID=2203219 RepID=UPI000E5AAF75|nr:site-specific integrase [Chitinophaga alhagiae]
MATHTLSVDFIARKTKYDKTLAGVYARITIDADEKEVSLREIVTHDKWDPVSETVKGKSQEAKDFNIFIDKVRNKLTNIFRELSDVQEAVSSQEVKDAYTGKTKKEYTVLKLIDSYIKKVERRLAPGTMKNFGATRQYMENFIIKTFKSTDIHVRQLNYAFISNWESFIPENPLKKHDPCKGNGIAHHIERFKSMVSWGVDMGWLKKEPFRKFSAHRTKPKRKRLRPHQLFLVETKLPKRPELIFARDLFLFSCYTGFSFAEVSRISMSDFEISNTGAFWCTMYRKKSSELEAIPVLEQAVLLIKKYKDLPTSIANGTIFPPITNQQINRSLKILQEIYEIPFELTFHVARHTFGYIAVKYGIDIKIVKAFMGHTKITTTDIYTDVDEEMAEEAMKKIEQARLRRQELPSPKQYLEKPAVAR